jgi:hypothetical protein
MHLRSLLSYLHQGIVVMYITRAIAGGYEREEMLSREQGIRDLRKYVCTSCI